MYFPLFFDLTDKNITVVGSGTIAKRRIRSLIPFCKEISVISRSFDEEMTVLKEESKDCRLQYICKAFDPEDIREELFIVLACTDDHALNEQIQKLCKEKNVFVNVCSDKELCDFYFPGIAYSERGVIGVTAGGRDHKAARELTEKAKRLLNE